MLVNFGFKVNLSAKLGEDKLAQSMDFAVIFQIDDFTFFWNSTTKHTT